MYLNKPKALKLGDTIGLIAPSSPTSGENVRKAERVISDMGFKVKMGRSPYEVYGYLSGSDELRVSDINDMFGDPTVDGIIALRGGYGTPRILDLIDYDLIRKNPKVFVGYSDITALHIAFTQMADLVTFHGPMVTSDMIDGFHDFSKESLLRNILDTQLIGKIENPGGQEIIVINGGVAEGSIIGGNLSLIVGTLGTPYEIDLKGKILFIEEVGEEPYNIDRMLNQLRLSGKFNDAVGIIFGDFNDCGAKKQNESLTVEQVIKDYMKNIKKPVIGNLKAGHCSPMVTIPLGVKARIDGDNGEFHILENTTI